MSFNAYKKEFYTSPRHLSILRESPEDMFLNGERSEDIYVNFEDRSVINNSALTSFIKPLPARPNKPPPPLPSNTVTYSVEPIHPPVPLRVSSNNVTMVTASTQTNRGTVGCIEGSVLPDILAFTVNNNNNNNGASMELSGGGGGSPTYQYGCNYDDDNCIGKSEIGYPTEMSGHYNTSVDIGSYITKFIDMMHDQLSWSVDNSGGNNGTKCAPTLDISRFEMRRNAEKEFYQVLNDQIDISMREYYLRVFGAIQQIRNYCETLRVIAQYHNLTELNNYLDYEPGEATCNLMKMSFNENYRRIICSLGGLEALAQLIVINNSVLGDMANNYHLTVRRYTCMALTNLTFGIGENKSLLCSIEPVLLTLVEFLSSCSEEVKQVSASVIRNLSWKADEEIKMRLKEANISKILTTESMKCAKESCLKSVLSALWNISSHCKENKVDICEVPGALAYFVDILSFKTIALVESSGGILRNISGVIASSEKYRSILRQDNAFQILLKHLRSSSLTVVGNACGTLCSLSNDCKNDQQLLWDLGAVGMLKNLVHSKHKTISIGSASTLKNLLSARASLNIGEQTLINALRSSSTSSSNTPDSSPRVMSPSPSLHVRKLSALESEIECVLRNNLSTPLSTDGKGVHDLYSIESPLLYRQGVNSYVGVSNNNESSQLPSFSSNISNIKRSDSDDSIISAHSDLTYDKVNFQSINSKLKLNGQSKQSNTTNNFMSLSGYSNSSGHYDLTIEHCMKMSSLAMKNTNSNSDIIDTNISNTNIKKRSFHSYPEDYDSDSSEKPLDYSRQFGDTDEYMTYPAPIITNPNETSQINPQVNIFRNIINIPPPTIKEKPKVYATEGTPVQCGSRMSPLSEELEEDETMNMGLNQYNPMQIIHEDARCFPASKKPELEKIEERVKVEVRENYSANFGQIDNGKSNKSVKFESEPPHIIQDTPLMFSRSSSVESLDSFDTHSFHSSVQSEYSRRTSEAVSPSELPDSPGSDTCQRRDQKSAQTTKSKNSNSMSYSSSLSIDDNISTGNSNNSSAILQQCIESGMPNPKASSSSKSYKMVKNNGRFIDELETAVCYAVEDTPYNYSTKASSLSDISISDPLNDKNNQVNLNKSSSSSSSDTEEHSELLSEIIQSAMPKGINSSSSFAPIQSSTNYGQTEQINIANNCSTFVALSNPEYSDTYPMVAPHKAMKPQIDNSAEVNISKLSQFFYCDIDSPRQYGVEGTPNSLSQRDSICSETNLMIKISPETMLMKPSQVPPKPPKRTTSALSSVPEKTGSIHVNEEDNNQEECHIYMTENTPGDYSRASPISHSLLDTPSVHETDNNISKDNIMSQDSGSSHDSKSISDDKSSLSSLSIESAGMERTLLQQCISSAMPAPKLKQPTVYGRRNHSSDHINGTKGKCQIQSEMSTNDSLKNSFRNNLGNVNDTSVSPLNIDSRKKSKTTSKLKKVTDYQTEAPEVKAAPNYGLPKSKLPEPKILVKSSLHTQNKSISANESASSSKPSSEKSANSYPKSKSSCSLKSVLRYNSCVPSQKPSNKQLIPKVTQNETEKNLKVKSDLSMNCHFLVNGFDVNPSGLAASKNNITEASPSPQTDESLHSIISVDNHTYSIDDKARSDIVPKKDTTDTTSDSDTLELVEITGLLDEDFLKDESSSLEIDAAFCRNVINREPTFLNHDTDEDLTDDEFNQSFQGKQMHSDNVIDDIMKDGVEAVLSSLNFQFCNDRVGGFMNDFLSVVGSEDGDSFNLEMDASSLSSAPPSLTNKSKGRPRIVKPTVYTSSTDNDSNSSLNSVGIRGGRKSLMGRKKTSDNVVNAKMYRSPLITNKPATYQKKISKVNNNNNNNNNNIATVKVKPVIARSKSDMSEARVNVTNINRNNTTSSKIVKPISANTTRSSLPKFQNKSPLSNSSKIPGLSNSNIMLRTAKLEGKSIEEKKRARSSTELRQFNVKNVVNESNLNESLAYEDDDDDDDESEGVWIVRDELCPHTVCIK